MPTLLEMVLAVPAVGATGTAVATGLGVRRLRRGNRLVPHLPTPAPLVWRWGPRREARLHRRLQRVCRQLDAVAEVDTGRRWRRSAPGAGPLDRLGTQIVAEAVVLDRRLAAASRLSGSCRRTTLAGLAGEVAGLEAGAARLHQLGLRWQAQLAGAGAPVLAEPSVDDGLDAFEAAMVTMRSAGPPARP